MTTFVIRRPITRTQRRAEVARRLPVDAEIMICAGREIIGLFGVPATTRHRNTITAIARVLGKGGAWSTGEPSWAAAQQTFAAVSRSIVCVLRAPYFIRLQLHGSRSASVCHPRTETVTMSRAEHWEHVYQTMGSDQVSWFQAEARLSRQLIETLAPARSSAIIDIIRRTALSTSAIVRRSSLGPPSTGQSSWCRITPAFATSTAVHNRALCDAATYSRMSISTPDLQ